MEPRRQVSFCGSIVHRLTHSSGKGRGKRACRLRIGFHKVCITRSQKKRATKARLISLNKEPAVMPAMSTQDAGQTCAKQMCGVRKFASESVKLRPKGPLQAVSRPEFQYRENKVKQKCTQSAQQPGRQVCRAIAPVSLNH